MKGLKKILIISTSTVAIIGLLFYTTPILETMTKWTKEISAPNWADVVSSTCAAIALMLAFATYINWSQSKVRDDLYGSIKTYIECFARLSSQTTDSFTLLDGLVPKVGMQPVHPDEAIETLREVEMSMHDFGRSFKDLHFAKEEFEFWGVKFTKAGEDLHDSTARITRNFMTCYFVTMNQALNFYKYGHPLDDFLTEAAKLETRFNEMRLIFAQRKNSGINRLFLF